MVVRIIKVVINNFEKEFISDLDVIACLDKTYWNYEK